MLCCGCRSKCPARQQFSGGAAQRVRAKAAAAADTLLAGAGDGGGRRGRKGAFPPGAVDTGIDHLHSNLHNSVNYPAPIEQPLDNASTPRV